MFNLPKGQKNRKLSTEKRDSMLGANDGRDKGKKSNPRKKGKSKSETLFQFIEKGKKEGQTQQEIWVKVASKRRRQQTKREGN